MSINATLPPPPPPPPPPAAAAPAAFLPLTAPDWPKDAVWVQIFPDRFRNGTPASDPTPADLPSPPPPGWHITPWSMEWYGRDTWERGLPFFSTVFHRRYGGDLQGLRSSLPYLQSAGFNAIYLNPIFHAPSLHKYDATQYHHIDPTLGPDRAGDLALLAAAREDLLDPSTWIWTAADRAFLALLADVHSRGMRLIIDGVFNHSGTAFPPFRDLRQRGPASPFLPWFPASNFVSNAAASSAPADPSAPPFSFSYPAWDGPNGSLPSFARTPDGENLADPVKQYLFHITRRWMDPSGHGRPSEGVDGWRLDVAYCLPHPFWREWHALVRSINPLAYTTAEIVSPAQDWLRPDEFSAVMNYEWLYPTLSFFTPSPLAISADTFRARIQALHARHPFSTTLILQNLLESHDTGRILTLLHSACPPFTAWDAYFNYARSADNPSLDTTAPSPRDLALLRLAAFWQYTSPGAPMTLYGTEVGLWGANDPCCRQPMLWDDIPADPETCTLRGPAARPPVPRAPDHALLATYRELAALRAAHPALRRGSFAWLPLPPDAPPSLLAYTRTLGNETLLCAINKSDAPLALPPPFPQPALLPPLAYILQPLPSAAPPSPKNLSN